MQDPVPLVSLSRGGAPSNAGYDAIVFRYAVWLGCWSGLLRDLCMALLTRSHRSWGSSICFVSSYAAAHHSQNQGHVWVVPLGLHPPHVGPAPTPFVRCALVMHQRGWHGPAGRCDLGRRRYCDLERHSWHAGGCGHPCAPGLNSGLDRRKVWAVHSHAIHVLRRSLFSRLQLA